MAHKKGLGSTRNGRDSNPKFRGVKKFGGEAVIPGNIIVRQKGTHWHPGSNVGMGRDYTIYSLVQGVVRFERFGKTRQKVSVYPESTGVGSVAADAPAPAVADSVLAPA